MSMIMKLFQPQDEDDGLPFPHDVRFLFKFSKHAYKKVKFLFSSVWSGADGAADVDLNTLLYKTSLTNNHIFMHNL